MNTNGDVRRASRDYVKDAAERVRCRRRRADRGPPLGEWSPYSRVHAPHLDGFFRTSHGEFRLVELAGGRTRLEGRTWYSLDMAPALYWTTIADTIVHAIHRRVLDHIKGEAEGDR
jgi:hypothetical protein